MKANHGSADQERAVVIGSGWLNLQGDLSIPAGASGVVLFAHGSGSSRFSPRNRLVAKRLREAGVATLLMDLLTPEEEREDAAGAKLRFNIPLLTERVALATIWLRGEPQTAKLRLGYFGASTGAAAALMAAAQRPDEVSAVVSRGGRPDLAGPSLSSVRAPTLLIVGGEDYVVMDLNREAMKPMSCPCELVIVPGATHLFEEPGTLEQVADHAAKWFVKHLGGA